MTTPGILDTEPAELPRAKPVFGYYRKSDGEITVSVTSPMERMHYMEEGWVYLPQYGTFDLTSSYAAGHPFELLFLMGGAKEMPVKQVLANGFHVQPPEVPRCRTPITQTHKRHYPTCYPMTAVVFPQLDESNSQTFPCKFESCARSQPEQALPTASALRRHEMVMHKEETGDIRTGTVLAEALLKGLSGSMGRQPMSIPDVGFSANQKAVLEAAGITLVKLEKESKTQVES